ncbi:hypothetical protein M0811_01116 [Anaeramoeba ignava]|uniref:Uncharacterized protein n=1 Tax=Anaeramoeba ignava TaxID=1746090 RepID=A0A9Q0LL34_ANAIG|nr:hypothetical protein M0811_01116 [Anaeramoeba ignava]|eukprot:Anaeramoba_ignava/a5712_209.p1 GENE.a5712_209~~a5712_209.p1  ORF type:complete len:246 (-),score=31.79 a5712_209:31-768(-)
MCFSQPISLVLSVIGIILSIYLRIRYRKDKDIWRLVYPSDYFTAMEILQFFQYYWVNDCNSQVNIYLTWIGYLHISFQPLFSNILASYDTQRRRPFYSKLILPMCIISGTFMFTRFLWTSPFPCDTNLDPLCGARTCTFDGTVHFKWQLVLRAPNYFTPGAFIHAFMMFVPPLLIGSKIATLVLLITGPVLGYYLSRNKDEWASIWCFYSIFQVILGTFATLYLKHRREKRIAKSKQEDNSKKEN